MSLASQGLGRMCTSPKVIAPFQIVRLPVAMTKPVPGNPIRRSVQIGVVLLVYAYPPSITNEIPRQWFWRLMNNVRRGPNLGRFAGARSLKNVSSLE